MKSNTVRARRAKGLRSQKCETPARTSDESAVKREAPASPSQAPSEGITVGIKREAPQEVEEPQQGILERAANIRHAWSSRPYPQGVGEGAVSFMHACVLAANKGEPGTPATDEAEFRKMVDNVHGYCARMRQQHQPQITITCSVMYVPASKRRRR